MWIGKQIKKILRFLWPRTKLGKWTEFHAEDPLTAIQEVQMQQATYYTDENGVNHLMSNESQERFKGRFHAEILGEFAEMPKPEDYSTMQELYGPKKNTNHPDPRLPKNCPKCGRFVEQSKIDDRVAGCRNCNMVFVTKEAYDDPNFQRDITHANLGITPKQTKVVPLPNLHMLSDAVDIIRMREIDRARAFGQGYTLGKFGMTRKELNEKMRKEEEEDV